MFTSPWSWPKELALNKKKNVNSHNFRKFPEFSVKWFAFRKFNNFLIFWIFSLEIYVPFVPVSKISEILVEWSAPPVSVPQSSLLPLSWTVRACFLLEDKSTIPTSVTAISMKPGIFEIVLSFNRPLTWQRWTHESFPSSTNRYCSSHVKAEVNKLDRSKQNNQFNCPTQLVSFSSTTQKLKRKKRSRKVSYLVPRKQIRRGLKPILQYKRA